MFDYIILFYNMKFTINAYVIVGHVLLLRAAF